MRKINGLIFEENHCGIPHAEKMHFQSEMTMMLQQRKAPPFVRELVLLVPINGIRVFFVCLFVRPTFKEIWLISHSHYGIQMLEHFLFIKAMQKLCDYIL